MKKVSTPGTTVDPARLREKMDIAALEQAAIDAALSGPQVQYVASDDEDAEMIDLAPDEYRVEPLPAERRALVKREG